jgi:hypothetical protein
MIVVQYYASLGVIPPASCRVHLAVRPGTKQKHQTGRAEPASSDKRAHLEGAHLFGESASV